MKRHSAIVFTSKEKAELQCKEMPEKVEPNEIQGKTLYSLISSGTEVTGAYTGNLGDIFPVNPGYAAVFRVDKCGNKVTKFKKGDIAFCIGTHQSFQQQSEDFVLKVPEKLDPVKAPFARLMGISMTTLITTSARPDDVVMVTGLGPVGYLASQIFKKSGYEVIGVEPDEKRRLLAKNAGIKKIYNNVPVSEKSLAGTVALIVECSGHEQAVLDACKIVRRRGEVVLIGVPWSRRTDKYAHSLLHLIFHNYVVLRSGWEWEIPRHASEFNSHSVFKNFLTALNWLENGSIIIDGMYSLEKPRDAQMVYQSILNNQSKSLFTLFDWR